LLQKVDLDYENALLLTFTSCLRATSVTMVLNVMKPNYASKWLQSTNSHYV